MDKVKYIRLAVLESNGEKQLWCCHLEGNYHDPAGNWQWVPSHRIQTIIEGESLIIKEETAVGVAS